jgi:hypothetical protein
MPLFRHNPRPPTPSVQFAVGVRDNRVIVGAERPGIEQLDELRDYVGSVTGHAGPTPDGRDPVAVLNAKMDFAELVDDAAAMAALAFEELIARDMARCRQRGTATARCRAAAATAAGRRPDAARKARAVSPAAQE